MAAAVLLLLAARSAAAQAEDHGAGRPVSVATEDRDRIDPDAPLLGVNVDLIDQEAVTRARTLEWLQETGIDVVRQPVPWPDVEPTADRFDWHALDRIASALEAADIAWVGSIARAPAWSRAPPDVPSHWMRCRNPDAMGAEVAARTPPRTGAPLARFAANLATRYPGMVGVEVWPEPNILPGWRPGGPDPEDYAKLLGTVAGAVRDARATALVISGGLAPTTDVGVCALDDVVFLDRLADTGVLEHVDAIGIQPFGLRTPPGARTGRREGLDFSRAERLHRVLSSKGIDRPLWAMAWGWHAGGDPDDSPWGSHRADLAAEYLRSGWTLARSEWPWMGPMFVWHAGPSVPPSEAAAGFRLLDDDGRMTALGEAVAEIGAGEIKETALPAPPEDATREPGWSWGVALALFGTILLIGGLGLFRTRHRVAPLLGRVLAAMKLNRHAVAVTALAGAVVVQLVSPWPVATAALLAHLVLAVARPEIALSLVTAAAPFWYALRLHAGPRPIGIVEGAIAIAIAGSLGARFWLSARRHASCGVPPSSRGRRADDHPSEHARDLPDPGARSIGERWRWILAGARPRPLDVAVGALVVWSAFTPLWAEAVGPAVREWRTVILEPALVYGLLRTWPSAGMGLRAAGRVTACRWALGGMVLGGGLASTWALAALAIQLLGGSVGGWVSAEGVMRAAGPYASPNNLALWLGRSIAVTVAFGILEAGARRRFWLAVLAPQLVAMVLTFSRGALLFGLPAMSIALGIALHRIDRLRGTAVRWTVVGVTAIVLILAPFAGSERIRSTTSLEPGSTAHIRVRLWQSSAEMIGDHPLLGVGLDNFLVHYRDRYVQRDAVQERFLNHPHNLVLDWWTRLGLPGVVVLVALLWGNLRSAVRGIRGINTSRGGRTVVRSGETGRMEQRRALLLAGLATQAYAVGHGLVDNHFFLVDLALAWWVAQAALIEAGRVGASSAAGAPASAAPDPRGAHDAT